MDGSAEILAELGRIKLAAYAILAVVTVTAVLTAIRVVSLSLRLVEKELGDLFRNEAQDLLDRGALDELITLANARIAERPNDVYAHWYRARVHRLREEWDDALREIRLVGTIAPEWDREYVKPFIEAVEEARRGGTMDDASLGPPPAPER